MPRPHLGFVGSLLHEAAEATPKEGHPWARPGGAEEVEGGPCRSRGAVGPEGPGATVGATWAASGRPTATTSPTPNAGRPTTSRTGAPNPSLSNPCSKVATILVTMVTIMTTRSFTKILTGNNGSSGLAKLKEF